VFFLGIDKGNTNEDVMLFDSIYGIGYPGVSGQEGGGNAVHFNWNVQATPTIVVITPDKLIASHQVWPPTTANLADSIQNAGGMLQSCVTDVENFYETDGILSVVSNPVKNFVKFTIQLERTRQFDVVVSNLSGQSLASLGKATYETGLNERTIDLTRFPQGLYFLQLIENGKVILTKKLILMR
jgi:hypothetical protein